MMRAWFMDSYDGTDKLRLGETPDPQPGPKEVLLRVKFAALNPADAFLAQAMYPAKPPMPHILGRDGVGEIVAAGADVKNVGPGDIVAILRCDVGVSSWGTLAEKVVVPADSLIAPPAGWTLEETAGAALTFLTSYQALTQWPDLPANAVLLVTGASGGVGSASVLLGKAMGMTVIALSRSAEKGAKLKEMGADYVFDPGDPNLRKAIPKKVDLVVDSVAGPLFSQLIAVLAHGGRISVVGRSGGAVPDFNTGTLFFRRNKIGGVAVSDYTAEGAQEDWKKIVKALGAKRPVVDQIFAFEDVKKAFARLLEGPMGKVLVQVS